MGFPFHLGPGDFKGSRAGASALCIPLCPPGPSVAESPALCPPGSPPLFRDSPSYGPSEYETKGGASWGVPGIGNTLVFSHPLSPGEPPKTPRLSPPTFRTTSMLLACPPSGTPLLTCLCFPPSRILLPRSSHPLENLIPLGTSIYPLDWAVCPQGFPSALCGLPLLSKALSSLLGLLIPPGSPRLSSFLLPPGSPSSTWPLTPPRALSDIWTGFTIIQHPSYPLFPFAFWGPPPSSMATLPWGTLHPQGQALCPLGPPLSSRDTTEGTLCQHSSCGCRKEGKWSKASWEGPSRCGGEGNPSGVPQPMASGNLLGTWALSSIPQSWRHCRGLFGYMDPGPFLKAWILNQNPTLV